MQIDKAYIERFDVIHRYNQDRLNAEELEGFEIYILEHPEIIPVIEEEKLIQEAVGEQARLLKRPIPWFQGLAAAAVLVLAVLVVAVFSDRPDYSLQEPVILETFRGNPDRAVQVNGEPIVQFQIDVGPPELAGDSEFTAALVAPDGEEMFHASGLRADSEGWLRYVLEGQDEPLSGNYEVRVSASANPNDSRTFSVTFTE